MKKNLWLLVVFIFTLFSCIDVHALDVEKDQKLISAITSEGFVNHLIVYPFEDKEYPIRIIHNPEGKVLWGPSLLNPVSLKLMVFADVPIPLARYVEDLVLELRGSYENCYFLLKDGEPEQNWSSIWPIHMAERVDDPINDELIQRTFGSTSFGFINQVIYYRLNNQYYRVRLLNNPEGRTFSATKKIQLHQDGPLESFSYQWNKIYAIVTDKKAPKELINHLSAALKHISYWNWYFNFDIDNGTFVTYTEHGYNQKIIYDLDTCFNYMETFGQDIKDGVN